MARWPWRGGSKGLKITRHKMARVSALARADRSEGHENRATHQRTGAPPKYPQNKLENSYRGCTTVAHRGPLSPGRGVSTSHKGFPILNIFIYVCAVYSPTNGAPSCPEGHAQRGSFCLPQAPISAICNGSGAHVGPVLNPRWGPCKASGGLLNRVST